MSESTEEKVKKVLNSVKWQFGVMMGLVSLFIGVFSTLSVAANNRSIRNEIKVELVAKKQEYILALYRSAKLNTDYLTAYQTGDTIRMKNISKELAKVNEKIEESTGIIFRGE